MKSPYNVHKVARFALYGAGAMLATACQNPNLSIPSEDSVDNKVVVDDSKKLTLSGELADDFKVAGLVLSLPDFPEFTENDLADALKANSDIARDAIALQAMTRAVETKSGTVDLYAGEKLAMTLELKDSKWMVRESSQDFKVESIDYSFGAISQSLDLSRMTFQFRQCIDGQSSAEGSLFPMNIVVQEPIEEPIETIEPIAPTPAPIEPVQICTNVTGVLSLSRIASETETPEPVVVAPATPAEPVVVAPATPAEPVVVAPATPAEPVVVAPATPAEPVVVAPATPAEPVVVAPATPAEPVEEELKEEPIESF